MPADPAFPLRRWEWGLLAAGLAVRTFLGAASIRAQSPTYDEPIHLAAGVAYWRTGDYGLNGAWHPPLGSLVAGALPVLAGADVPRGHPLWRRPVWTDPDRQYAFANDLLTDGGKTPMDRWLSLGRSAMLGVTHLLPVLVFLAARSVGGPAAGATAFIGAVLCPALTAHGALATTDAVLTLFFFASFFALHAWDRSRRPAWAALSGAALGLALCSKATAAVFLPAPFLWIGFRERSWKGVHAALLLAASLSAATAAVYHVGQLPLLFRMWKNDLTVITTPRESYFLGSRATPWERAYFPVVFLLKTPGAVLFGALGALLALRRRREEVPPLLWAPGLLYFLAACASPLKIGHRHILPVYPFLYVLLGAGLGPVLRERRGPLLVGALGIWLAAAAVRASPFPLAYFNEFAGGPAAGYRYLADSSVDWGQGLKALKSYLDERGVRDIYLSYFGSVNPRLYGLHYLDVASIGRPPYGGEEADPCREKRALLAVSATDYQGASYDPSDFLDWLHGREPCAVVADSLLVFDVTEDLFAHRWLAAFFRGTSRPAAAAREDRRARELQGAS